VAEPAPTSDKPARGHSRRTRREQLSRQEILDAALELARDGGWARVTMRAIADRLDASAAYAYRYFDGRDAIILALIRNGFARLLDTMRAAADRADDPVQALRAAKHAYARFALNERELYQAMYGLGGVSVPPEHTWQQGAAIGELDAELLSRITGRPAREHDDDVLLLWAAVHGLIALADGGRVTQPINAPDGPVDRALDDTLTRVRNASA
jgi:AcrR family transcriptional regulator